MGNHTGLIDELKINLGDLITHQQITIDEVITIWVGKENILGVLTYLKNTISSPFKMLYDLCAIDERTHAKKNGNTISDFTIVYHLLSFERNCFIRVKVALSGEYPSLPSIHTLWQNANWYEREVFDMFGIKFIGHPHLKRILMPATWQGYPLRKDHPARATEMGPFKLGDEKQDREQEAMQFNPEEWVSRDTVRMLISCF